MNFAMNGLIFSLFWKLLLRNYLFSVALFMKNDIIKRNYENLRSSKRSNISLTFMKLYWVSHNNLHIRTCLFTTVPSIHGLIILYL